MNTFPLNSISIFVLFGILGSSANAATSPNGVNFTHKEWQLACDNTHTCRAVGATNNTLALMITRNAGPNQLPTANLKFSNWKTDSFKSTLVGGIKQVLLRINDRLIGRLNINSHSDYLLDELQTAAVIDALKGSARVSFEVVDYSAASKVTTLSGQGAYAVFLKMDETQKRIGTPAALVKKGLEDENSVIYPLKVPVIHRVMPEGYHVGFMGKWLEPASVRVLVGNKLIESLDSPQDCAPLQRVNEGIRVYPLNETHVLLSAACQGMPGMWESPASRDYREGYWTIDKKFLGVPSLITISATDYGNGLISEYRDPAMDCGEYKSWIWDGVKFVLGNSYIQGICNKKISLVSQGWKMPTVVVNEIIPGK
ncbi:MAG: DUF1176 domain-containing protein [Pseudomonas veronii]|jgi:hypothetical protein|nr:DUF1176 domain-containing protein [Pseudomonas veronii]